MDTCPSIAHNNYTRKRRRNPENWKRNKAKVAKYSPTSLPQRICSHNTKSLKCATLTMANLKKIHEKFYSHKNKKDQDSFILKCCSIKPVKPRPGQYKGRKQTTTKYFLYLNSTKIPVCQQHFLHTLGVTKHRVAYVMQRFHYVGDVIITEKRGGDRKEQSFAQKKQSIHSFIQKLKCVESHYCRKTKTAERKYLPSNLNINKLYKIYKESEYAHAGVKQSYFRHIFNSNYNLGFGTPKTDACSTCLELGEKISSETDPNKKTLLMTEKRVHSLRAKAFYEKLQEQAEGLKIISFDCQKNLPLPKLPDQMSYYSRQLYFYNFTMVEGSSISPLTPNRVFTYYCTENEFHKDSNLVASAVTHRLNSTDLTGVSTIRLVADGCGGQNKNCILVGACCKWLLEHQNIKTIEMVFPVTGHSFMPADRQFGIAEKKLKKMDVIVHPDAIRDVLAETSTLVQFGDDCSVFNWRDAVKQTLKPTTSWPFAFKQCKRFILKRSKKQGNVLVRGELFYKSDTATGQNVCQRNKLIQMINPQQLPNVVPVNKNKLTDVNKLLQKHFGPEWRDLPTLSFYKDILNSQEALTAPETTENYCEEGMEEPSGLRV